MREEFRIKEIRGPEGQVGRIHKPTQEELLEHYATKLIRGVLEIDAHGLCEEGVVIHTCQLYDLRNSDVPVRMQIMEGAKAGEVLFYLSEVMQMLREDWYRLDEWGSDAGFRPKLPQRGDPGRASDEWHRQERSSGRTAGGSSKVRPDPA